MASLAPYSPHAKNGTSGMLQWLKVRTLQWLGLQDAQACAREASESARIAQRAATTALACAQAAMDMGANGRASNAPAGTGGYGTGGGGGFNSDIEDTPYPR